MPQPSLPPMVSFAALVYVKAILIPIGGIQSESQYIIDDGAGGAAPQVIATVITRFEANFRFEYIGRVFGQVLQGAVERTATI